MDQGIFLCYSQQVRTLSCRSLFGVGNIITLCFNLSAVCRVQISLLNMLVYYNNSYCGRGRSRGFRGVKDLGGGGVGGKHLN